MELRRKMEFRTRVNIKAEKEKFHQGQKLLSLGSCFAENVGNRLTSAGFDILINPLGILFNPKVIADNIKEALSDDFDESLIVRRDGIYFHYLCHSDVNGIDENALRQEVNARRKAIRQRLKEADHLILTFGTAWVYRHKATDKIVANCHKVPQINFSKSCLSNDELIVIYESLIKQIVEINPSLQILLTVSPVRHVKNGLVDNNRSKAELILLSHKLTEKFDNVSYFPAYEIVMDELRDYRFFDKDMIHPNEVAIDYVYEQFVSTYFDDSAKEIGRLTEKIQKLENHKPRFEDPDQEAAQRVKINIFKEQVSNLKSRK